MQIFSSKRFCEQDLQQTLAKLLCKLKNPYLNTTPNSTSTAFCETVKFSTTLPCSTLELQAISDSKKQNITLDLNFVHILFTQDEHMPVGKLRLESLQFNQLMEKVCLPVFIWENRSRQQFELHWQERSVNLECNSMWIWSVFEQSLSLASAFKERLGKQNTAATKKIPYRN